MAEWLYEEGIGENRAALVEGGSIIEAAIELPSTLRAGAIVQARLRDIAIPGRRAIAEEAGGQEILIEPLPAGLTEGAAVHVEIVREAIGEAGRPKRAKGRITDAEVKAGSSLLERIGGSSAALPVLHHRPDLLEQAGWSELLEQAERGDIPFTSGALRMSVTPAMTLFDVDGWGSPATLAIAAAHAAAAAIRRFDITGSIGIDFPTLTGKDDRKSAAEAIDAVLPQPFERTAVNGFGFLQIVRRRQRPSLPELLREDPAAAAARALLRRAERTPGHGTKTLIAAPPVIRVIEGEPDWLQQLSRRTGTAITLQADAGLAISGGHVHRAFA